MTNRAKGLLWSGVPSYIAVVFLLMPLAVVIPISFTPKRFLSMPEGEISFRHYGELLADDVWRGGIVLSIGIGLTVAFLATALAVLFAVGIWYSKSAYTKLLVSLALVPMAVPPVISALTLFFFTTRANMYDTVWGVVIAHTVMALPYAVVTILVALSQVDRRLELAARNLGASIWQTTGWVVLPNIKLGIGSALLLSFVLSWEEISVTLFVTSVDVVTLPRLMWSGLRDSISPVIAAIAVVLIAISTLCAWVSSGAGKGGEAGR